ncbi:MAG TPA: helix-turn-helix domain-containing protein [Actinocrinis sp.]|jgi:excisionase family DNA binding protein|uniref:helix-turn-helix domain-containing protein n=1 Tax=Actinocrinis sp. TaxID=1920516 RepID=UPI002DDCE40C|nr:helix-turn-helix domain-containing protein [Actinocrinis sp.]HEV3170371.1 helix-turn-helix domain-containing protein [Actinocrinis sp.]
MNNDEQRQPTLQEAPDRTALLTVREAYLRLRISKWKLYDLIRTRRLSSIQIGRRRFVPVDALRAYVQQRSQESLV